MKLGSFEVQGRTYRVVNDSLFEHLFGRYHWLKDEEATHWGDSTSFSYCVKRVQLRKILGRVYVIVDFENDKVEQVNEQ